jgi:hypothetical protein
MDRLCLKATLRRAGRSDRSGDDNTSCDVSAQGVSAPKPEFKYEGEAPSDAAAGRRRPCRRGGRRPCRRGGRRRKAAQASAQQYDENDNCYHGCFGNQAHGSTWQYPSCAGSATTGPSSAEGSATTGPSFAEGFTPAVQQFFDAFLAVSEEMAAMPIAAPTVTTAAVAAPASTLAVPVKVGLQVAISGTPQIGTWRRHMPAVSEREEDFQRNAKEEETQGDPRQLAETLKLIKQMEERLADPRRAITCWHLKALRPLALSSKGCRVVQKALELEDGELRLKLLDELAPYVVELYESLNGNHVLSKVVEVIPAANLGQVIATLQEHGWEEVAKHRFGCRVVERLIEHCNEAQLSGLIEVVLAKTALLSRHRYGNFVVQVLFEHAPNCRKGLLEGILGNASNPAQIPQLAMHLTASHVVQRALDHCEEEGQARIVQAMLRSSSTTIEDVACGRYGSYVAEQLVMLLSTELVAELKLRFESSLDVLCDSLFGRRVALKFGFPVPAWGEAARRSRSLANLHDQIPVSQGVPLGPRSQRAS